MQHGRETSDGKFQCRHRRAAGMKTETLLKTGIVGTVILLICCFTPVLVILFAAIGLSALVGWLDFVLLPALAVFTAITGYALWKRKQAA